MSCEVYIKLWLNEIKIIIVGSNKNNFETERNLNQERTTVKGNKNNYSRFE